MKPKHHQPATVRRQVKRFREGQTSLDRLLETLDAYLDQFPHEEK